MQTIIADLSGKFQKALLAVFGSQLEPGSDLLQPELTQSTQPQFGHYQCNNALKLAKHLRSSPRNVADQIIRAVNAQTSSGQPMIKEMVVAGPGFINITLDTQFLSTQITSSFKGSCSWLPK